MIYKWKCGFCQDVVESDSTLHHVINYCKCGDSSVDLEEDSMWVNGDVIGISKDGVLIKKDEPKEYTEEDLRQAFYKGREIADIVKGHTIFLRPTFNGYLRELDGEENPYVEFRKRKKSEDS